MPEGQPDWKQVLDDLPPIDRRCPRCEAIMGEPCTSINEPFNPLPYFHGARRPGRAE